MWVADVRRIQSELGWRPRSTLDEGLRTLAEWFRQQPSLRTRYLAKN